MGALKIDCYCNEKQMASLVKAVTGHLYESDRSEIPDFDDVICGVRVCVEFLQEQFRRRPWAAGVVAGEGGA